MNSLILFTSLFLTNNIQNPQGFFPSLLGSTGVVQVESAVPNQYGDFSVQAWGSFFSDDPFISGNKHSRNRMRLTANFTLPKGLEVFSGTSFTFNESSNSGSSSSSTSFFENTDLGLRWGKWLSENFLAVGFQGYGRFFSGTQARRNKSGFSRGTSGPFLQGELQGNLSMDFRELLKEIPLRTHFNLGYRTPNSDLKPAGTANREDQIEMFNLDAYNYQAITGGFAVEIPFKWVNPYIEFITEYALFPSKNDGTKFKHNRQKVGTGVKVTPHESVAFLIGGEFGLLGDTAATRVPIAQNNPWEVFVGLQFSANSKDLFKTIGKLRGQVTDAETGFPLPDVEVTLVREVTLPRVSDLSGTYEMQNLDVKDYQIKFSKEGYLAQTLTTKIEGGETTQLDVALRRPGPKLGNMQSSIIDGTTGGFIPKAFARISGTEKPLAADESGTLKVEGIPVGTKTIRVEAPGYLPQEFPIEIFENETIKQSFTLHKEPSKVGNLTGRVTNEEGTGLTAVITGTDERISPFGTNPVNGTFNQALSAGEYEVKVVAENYLPETVKVNIVAGEQANLDVKLKKPEVAVVIDDRIILPDAIFFDFNSEKVQKRSLSALDQVVSILKENDAKYKILRVEGHTDDAGAETYNAKLSKRRSSSVRKYIVSQGILAERVEAIGFGETKPIATNLTEDGRSENRRVEFYLVRDE